MCRIIACFLLLISARAFAIVTADESRAASVIIGKWLSRSTGHFDFYSATPVAPKRAGDKFMITIAPSKQYASDYGISLQQIKRDQKVTQAYETLGFDTDQISETINFTRLHANFGITNDYDFTLSYLMSDDDISGWGVGFKQLLIKYRYFYLSHRVQIAHSKLPNYFDNWVISNDLSMSLYFILLDFYTGVRHNAGRIRFHSTLSDLSLPVIKYIADLSELELYYGVVLATTYNTRLTLQANKKGEEYSYGLKFSFHFDSLLPTATQWFKDPRYIKQ